MTIDTMESALRETLLQAVQQLGVPGAEQLTAANIHLEHPADRSHGDYATNLAMQLFGQAQSVAKTVDTPSDTSNNNQEVPSAKNSDFPYANPRELAKAIVDHIGADVAAEQSPLQPFFNTMQVAGPGFINLSLSKQFLIAQIGLILDDKIDYSLDQFEGQKVVVEFTDPNPFKEFHAGHLFSNVVGESLSRLFAQTGAKVSRFCYQGDVGMHVAKSIWGLMQKLDEDQLSMEALAKQPLADRIAYLGQSYAKGATAFKESDSAKQNITQINALVYMSAQQRLVDEEDWQPQVDYASAAGEYSPELFQRVEELYREGRAWSLAYFETIYQRLGTEFDGYFFESVAGEHGAKIVKAHLGDVFIESQGAIIFPGEEYGLHNRVFINSKGLPTYESKDLALPEMKAEAVDYDQSFIITANEVDEYFQVVLKALTEISPDYAAKTNHVSHGMLVLPSGKMSSRTGNIITGDQFLEEAYQRVKTKMSGMERIPADKLEEIAQKVALAAVKFHLLKSAIGKNVVFSFDEALSFTGQSGPYLQYAVVRGLSILRKMGLALTDVQNISTSPSDIQDHLLTYTPDPTEVDLLRYLYSHSEVIKEAACDYAPHHLANYLFELAQAFSSFYNNVSVVESSEHEQQIRLALVAATVQVLQNGIHLLGFESVDQM